MAKREFLMLAHVYNASKWCLPGSFMSEKLDGHRCFWDGGITRGWLKADVPWAKTDKDSRYKDTQYATGLWSRYGNVIHAPDWFLDQLPAMPLDGELWVGRSQGDRQRLAATIKRLNPDSKDWRQVTYYVFDTPPYEEVFANGKVNGRTLKDISLETGECFSVPAGTPFRIVYNTLKRRVQETSNLKILSQHELQYNPKLAMKDFLTYQDMILDSGGEGVMLRTPSSVWVPERSHHLVKVKKYSDAEAVVTGFISGRKTDLGSKHLGKIGALITDYQGKRLELSGMDDSEREFDSSEAFTWASEFPGYTVPDWIDGAVIKRGMVVTFKYRGITRDGIPQEASYMHIRENL